MSKKIIFVGPPSAGKTTLRKVFFEGENPKKLLNYALEPTHGQESIILKLSESIGIFDLAGQENQQWFGTEGDSIFFNAKIIIIVIDVKTSSEQLLDFVQKVITLRNLLTSTSMIFLLIHKIDLISEHELREIKFKLNDGLANENLIRTFYTSIKKEHFTPTLSIFIRILKTCLSDEITFSKLDFKFLEDFLASLNQIGDEMIISKKDLQIKLNKTEKIIDKVIKSLDEKGYITILGVKGGMVIKLTEKGSDRFNELRTNFEQFYETSEGTILTGGTNEKMPPIVGFYIADKSGKTILNTEVFKGAIEHFLRGNLNGTNPSKIVDVDLIPSFISALDIFSHQFNFEDLSSINLKGLNLKIFIFKYDKYNVIFFLNINISIKPLEKKIFDYFDNLIEKYIKEFEYSLNMSLQNAFTHINEETKIWIENMNKSCEKMLFNFELFDVDHAKVVYKKLDEIYDEINIEFYVALEKIKKLKMELLQAIVEEDFTKIKQTTLKIQDLRSKFLS